MGKKVQIKVFVFQIIAFEFGVGNSRNIQQDTWHRQAMCQQTHERFYLTLGEKFCESTYVRMMKKDVKSALIDILQVFGKLSHVDCHSVS